MDAFISLLKDSIQELDFVQKLPLRLDFEGTHPTYSFCMILQDMNLCLFRSRDAAFCQYPRLKDA